MIKAALSNGTIIIGLSDENMRRLADNNPIKFNLRDLNLPDREVFIFNGRTEDSMSEQLVDLMDLKKTNIKDER